MTNFPSKMSEGYIVSLPSSRRSSTSSVRSEQSSTRTVNYEIIERKSKPSLHFQITKFNYKHSKISFFC